MNAPKTDMLKEMFGEDTANTIISNAEMQTKALEDAGVKFKASGDDEGADDTDNNSDSSDSSDSADGKKKPAPFQKKEEDEKASTLLGDQIEALTMAVRPLVAMVGTIDTLGKAVAELQTEVKSMKDEAAKEKEKDASPRNTEAFKASASDTNLLDADKLKEATGIDLAADSEKNASNPVSPYVSMVFGGLGR